MTLLIAILATVVSCSGAIGYGIHHYMARETNRDSIVINNQVAPVEDTQDKLERIIAEGMKNRDSESDTEIDITINIHTAAREDRIPHQDKDII